MSRTMSASTAVAPSGNDLPWAPEIPVRWVDLDGIRVRSLIAGEGPAVVLRTQLDMYQRVIPQLAKRFRVYALDYPGHGWSDIPEADYTAEYYIAAVARYLDAIGVENATLVGESIGGTIALALAARRHPRVARVVAVNAYDYNRGRGIRRGSLVANLVFGLAPVPVLGEIVLSLRNPVLERKIFEGGVHQASSFPRGLSREFSRVGRRRGYQRAFLSLVRHWPSWETVRQEYGRIAQPILLVYGEYDWSNEVEREANRRAIPGNRSLLVAGKGHFLSLEGPDELVRAIVEFSGTRGGV